MKRGLAVDYVHFSGEPYLEPTATAKAQAQAKVLNGFQAERPGVLWVIPFGRQQRMLSAVSEESHRIVLYRRQMARVGCALADRLRAAALVTGDSLGQVSSQTLPNMTAVDEASELPILRPLLDLGQARGDGKAASHRDPRALRAGRRRRLPAVRGRASSAPPFLAATSSRPRRSWTSTPSPSPPRSPPAGSNRVCSWTGSCANPAPDQRNTRAASPWSTIGFGIVSTPSSFHGSCTSGPSTSASSGT